jgi:hypothetical protein
LFRADLSSLPATASPGSLLTLVGDAANPLRVNPDLSLLSDEELAFIAKSAPVNHPQSRRSDFGTQRACPPVASSRLPFDGAGAIRRLPKRFGM